LLGIATHDGLPAIVRSTALDLVVQIPSVQVGHATIALLDDPSPLVRASALPGLHGLTPAERVPHLSRLLADPTRTVRMAAARETLSMPTVVLDAQSRGKAEKATEDWHDSLQAKADYPEIHLVMGGFALTQRQLHGALAAFREATDLDHQLVQAWTMQARIH